jgi:hypothetical protein
MIHYQWSNVRRHMLNVARYTLLDARVKRGRLTTKQSLGIRVACCAVGDRNPDGRLVARNAALTQKSVPRRQWAWADKLLPHSGYRLEMHKGERRCRSNCNNKHDPQ